MSSLLSLCEALSPARRKLLSLMIQEEMTRQRSADASPALIRDKSGMPIPLSFAQQRLWVFEQLHPGTSLYNMTAAVRLSGNLNVPTLEQAVGEIVRRHDVLRTTFESVNGQISQIISQATPVRLTIKDISGLPEAEREQTALELTSAEAKRPFDLATGPLMRAGLLRLSSIDHIALFALHHIISDRWSMGVLIRELTALYESSSRGEASRLPELKMQYADFAVWQRNWLQGAVLEKQLQYWKDQLSGFEPLLLPTDRLRPSVMSYHGSIVAFSIPADTTCRVIELSQREGVTLFMTLLTVFKVLLNRYTGQDDLIVGANIANRNRANTEGLVGFFVNNLVMRTDLSGDPTFRELLSRVREMALGAYAHQDLPFEMLIEELHPERDSNQNPLFQVLFVLQNVPTESLEISGLGFKPIRTNTVRSKFDLTLFVTETDQRLDCSFEYNTDLFDAATIEQMRNDFRDLLIQTLADPDNTISSYSLVPESQSIEIINDFQCAISNDL